MTPRLVIFVFAGREANMTVQMPYLHRILNDRPEAEVHLWDLTRNPSDHRYLWSLNGAHDGRVRVLGHLHPGHPIPCMYPDGYPGGSSHLPRGWRRCECMIHKPPYEEPYRWYADQREYVDTTFIKVDDDVLFLETPRLDDLLDPLLSYPDRIISANVINNAVCAKYDNDRARFWWGSCGSADVIANDRAWWALHTQAEFARTEHQEFLEVGSFWIAARLNHGPKYERTRPGEAISINCIAFTHGTMQWLARAFDQNDRLGDEGAVDRRLPWIAQGFVAAHLAFGPQEKQMTPQELAYLRDRYTQLREAYLG